MEDDADVNESVDICEELDGENDEEDENDRGIAFCFISVEPDNARNTTCPFHKVTKLFPEGDKEIQATKLNQKFAPEKKTICDTRADVVAEAEGEERRRAQTPVPGWTAQESLQTRVPGDAQSRDGNQGVRLHEWMQRLQAENSGGVSGSQAEEN